MDNEETKIEEGMEIPAEETQTTEVEETPAAE
jgi:hypothetical protein